ncbi:MAG: hypothetical protein COU27_00580 [Candidatus Levybacteria bacterium CG10_big_fil_rev_8_21_14_0_10_36_7]|nr:MAG: hypothetical protein COU27_00580 [Candidatus Levybacteria bacterium CG10_big_fil_rev_8_21_14_0_10_36_7]
MKIKKEKGYTLIELLTVISILIILFSIIGGILHSSLRGSSKAKITTAVAQNGNYALSIISNIIISSKAVTKVGGVDVADCTASPSGQTITLSRADGGVSVLSCTNDTISSNSASLIDTTSVRVDSTSISNCYFYCNQIAGDPYAVPIVGFGFTLQEKSATLFENKSASKFESSASLRNYSP